MIYTDHLETPRLITRFLTQADIPAWSGFFNDAEATRFNPNPNNLSPHERADDWINYQLKRYSENRLGMQALISKENGDFIGLCGLVLQELDGKNEIEVGYHLFHRHWGKGYATEAARKFMEYGFEHEVAPSIISMIDPQNIRSKKVAGRNGLRLSATGVLFKDNTYDIFRITREEWEGLKK